MNKKDIYISFSSSISDFIEDIKSNFEYSKAFKYLEGYSQKNDNYNKLFDNLIDIYENYDYENKIDNYHIKEVNVRGYSQSERQDFYLYFNKQIEKDPEAIQDLKYFLQDLKYYFTCEDICFYGYIENVKIIDGKKYINKEFLDPITNTYLEESIEKKDIIEYITANGLDPDKYNLIYIKTKG